MKLENSVESLSKEKNFVVSSGRLALPNNGLQQRINLKRG
jgi:hypothetical protein